MTVDQMVQYLRLNVIVQDPDDQEVIDPQYLAMTDEELELFLSMSLSQNAFVDPLGFDIPSLDKVPQNQVMLLILFAKKELYFTLATRVAPQVDLGADNNNYIKRDQRFQHYLALIKQVDDEIEDAINDEEDGGGGTNGFVMTYDTTLPNRYFTPYNFDKGNVPTVRGVIQAVTDTTIEVAWKTSYISEFLHYRVWVSDEPVLDLYGGKQKIPKGLRPVYTTKDPHEALCRIEDLEPGTAYYVVVSATAKTGLTGYQQLEAQTLDTDDPEP